MAKAKLTGRDTINPGRLKGRSNPRGNALGRVSPYLRGGAVRAWAGFKRELPWLTESDRALVEIASMIRGRMLDGEDVGISAVNQLRLCLAQMGGSPADRSKITVPDGDEEDPEDALFGKRH